MLAFGINSHHLNPRDPHAVDIHLPVPTRTVPEQAIIKGWTGKGKGERDIVCDLLQDCPKFHTLPLTKINMELEFNI